MKLLDSNRVSALMQIRAGARAVDLRGLSIYQGGPKFEIKHKSRCLQKSKLVNWGAEHVDWGAQAPLGAGPDTDRDLELSSLF